ncbi:beta-galactosidase [Paenibacillus sp. FSL M8-0212]|uniref:beta-galactosidase n=1 Tax=Paenibacillus sp. FSL M8-0212 TaxID=2921618 RepID=UPI0030FA9766
MTIKIGIDYYPEQWTPELWEKDAILMQETGVAVVRMAEFAWSRMEPTEGNYQFEWLDAAIEVFASRGMEIVLCTPTNTPPNWMTTRYPDVLPIDEQRHIIRPGVRGHRCNNSPSLRMLGSKFVEAISQRYGKHPAVIGWQIDNEMHYQECHCDTCNRAFVAWLQKRYSNLEELNREWGTVVWSGEYSSWAEVTTPLGPSKPMNPSYLLEYKRFCSDSVGYLLGWQLEILRRNCPGQFVTHNMWQYPNSLDYYDMHNELDFVSVDYYPNELYRDYGDRFPRNGALTLDLVRGIKRRNFWVMEQLSGAQGAWMPIQRTPYPGLIRARSWQTIARGADMVVHFRWRSATVGAEQFWHGLIDHSNVPGRRFREFAELTREVNQLGELLADSTIVTQVAILHSHDQHTALSLQPQAEGGMHYIDNLSSMHNAFLKMGVGTDVINWTEELNGYKLVVVPSLFLLSEEVAQRLERFAAKGGTVVLTNRTGVKNMRNVCEMLPLPGLLAEAAGVVVSEYDAIGNSEHRIRNAEGKTFATKQWCDLLELRGTEPIAWYDNDFYEGVPAVTVNKLGEGEVYYVGTWPEPSYFYQLFEGILKEKDLAPKIQLPEGIELSIRTKGEQNFLFLINLMNEQREITLDVPYRSLLNSARLDQKLTLPALGVDILTV